MNNNASYDISSHVARWCLTIFGLLIISFLASLIYVIINSETRTLSEVSEVATTDTSGSVRVGYATTLADLDIIHLSYLRKVPSPYILDFPLCSSSELLSSGGVPESDHGYALYIFMRESTCNPLAVNRASGAVGLCQAMPHVHKLPNDYRTNVITQITWCNQYALNRYGSWKNAFIKWEYRDIFESQGWW